MMNDLWLMLLGPVLIAGIAGFVWLFDHFFGDCQHDFSEWCSYPDEHAYVQQKQCKKCQFVFTYQERKIGHEQHQHHNLHKR